MCRNIPIVHESACQHPVKVMALTKKHLDWPEVVITSPAYSTEKVETSAAYYRGNLNAKLFDYRDWKCTDHASTHKLHTCICTHMG